MENYPEFENLEHVIQHGLQGFIKISKLSEQSHHHICRNGSCCANNLKCSLRKQPSFFAPGKNGVSRNATRAGAKKDGCFRKLFKFS